jgi:hypothetical protein
MLLLGGTSTAAASASASATAARAPPPLGAWRARVSLPRGRRPTPSRPLAAPAAAASGPGGLPPEATVEDLLAALGTLSSGSDSDSESNPLGGANGSNERVVLPCGTVDYYALLQVDDDAPPPVIKRAYRGLARECHPDYR